MNKVKTISLIIVGMLMAWIGINALFDFHPERPEADNPLMKLDPLREGASLREVFETFPEYGAGHADLRLLIDNNLAWAARWDLLDKARETIDVSYFILKKDLFGVAFLSHLLEKAKEGVKVRILLDAYGSKLSWSMQGNDYLDALVNTGNVEIRLYRPLLDRALQGLAHLSLAVTVASEHDKILVVDGERAIVGGRNIADEYFAHPEDAEMVFRDVEVEIADRGVAGALTKAFETQFFSAGAEKVSKETLNLQDQGNDLGLAYQSMEKWLRETAVKEDGPIKLAKKDHAWAEKLLDMKHLKGVLSEPLPTYLNAETRVLDSSTRFGMPGDAISVAGIRLVESARHEIFIQNPYVMVSEETLDVFGRASKHGVPITLFTNSPASLDGVISQAVFLEQWPYLLSAVPTLRLYANAEDEMVHAKLATFDNTVSLIGTYNLSPLSMATNSEVVIAVWSSEFAEKLTQKPRSRIALGRPQVYRYRIQRSADGSPRFNEDGKPLVEFGPSDHIDLGDNEKRMVVRKGVEALRALTGVSPFF